mgnify:FL=1
MNKEEKIKYYQRCAELHEKRGRKEDMQKARWYKDKIKHEEKKDG